MNGTIITQHHRHWSERILYLAGVYTALGRRIVGVRGRREHVALSDIFDAVVRRARQRRAAVGAGGEIGGGR